MKSAADDAADVPPVVVTVTTTVPLPAGEVAVIELELVTLTPVAGLVPKSTVAPLEKPEPVMVTAVPPAAGPLLGLTVLTTGATP